MEANLSSPQSEKKACEIHVTEIRCVSSIGVFKSWIIKYLNIKVSLGLEIPRGLTVEKVGCAQTSQWNADQGRWNFLTPSLSRNQVQPMNAKKKGENRLDYLVF